jgi:hypothetical protein
MALSGGVRNHQGILIAQHSLADFLNMTLIRPTAAAQNLQVLQLAHEMQMLAA